MNVVIESPFTYYNRAVDLINERNITEALRMLTESLCVDNDDVDTLNLAGLCSCLLCKFKAADFYWIKSISIKPENNEAFEYLMSIHNKVFIQCICKYNEALEDIRKNKYRDAAIKLEQVIGGADFLIEPHTVLGLCYMEIKEDIKSKYFLEKAYSYDKGNINVIRYVKSLEQHTGKDSRKKHLKWIICSASAAAIAVFLGIGFCSEYKKNADYRNVNKNYKLTNADLSKKIESASAENAQLRDEVEELRKEYNKLKEEKNAAPAVPFSPQDRARHGQ